MPTFRRRADRIRGVARSFEKQHVLVADGTVGAGIGIARVFVDAGAQVTVVGSDSPAVDIALRSFTYAPIDPTGHVLKTASEEDLRVLLQSLASPVDVLIGHTTNPALDADTGLGFRSVATLAKLAAEQMAARGHAGSIVAVGNTPANDGSAPGSAYLEASMQTLANEHARDGIRVNMILAGYVAVDRRGKPEKNNAAPLGHVSVHPVEVGKAAWFLANDELNPAMTGGTLKIDRGSSLLPPEW